MKAGQSEAWSGPASHAAIGAEAHLARPDLTRFLLLFRWPREREVELTEEQQAKFEGWAIVEVMGHQRYVGFVTTEAYGQAVLFRIDVPELGERERELKRPEWIHNQNLPAGARIKESAVPGYTKLIGSGSIYAITPCTQEAAMAAVEEMQPRKLMLLSLPDTKALAAAAGSGDYSCCGGNLERGHKQSCDVERDEEGDDDESDDEDEDFL